MFVALTARELNPTIQIIARAETASTEKKLMRSGANRIVLPAVIGATKIAHMIVRPSAEDMLNEEAGAKALNEELQQIGLELTEVEVTPGSALVGQTIGDMEGGSGGFVIVAVRRPDGSLVRATDPDHPDGRWRRGGDHGPSRGPAQAGAPCQALGGHDLPRGDRVMAPPMLTQGVSVAPSAKVALGPLLR